MGERLVEHPYPVTVEGSWKPALSNGVKNKLQIYFQSKKKSSGGDCVVIYEDPSIAKANVYFSSEDARNRVLASEDHQITIEKETVLLRVSLAEENKEDQCSKSTDTANNEKSELESWPQSASATASWPGPNPDSGSRPGNRSGSRPGSGSGFGPHPGYGSGAGPAAGAGDGAESGATVGVGTEGDHQSSSVVLEGFPDSMSKELLGMIVESVCRLDEDSFSLELIPEINTAVVTFKNCNDVGSFLSASTTNKKFQKHSLSVRVLEKFQSVRVEKLTGALLTEEVLELYFEKWNQLKDCTLIPEEQAAIVTFVEPEGAEQCLRRDNIICSVPVDVYPYYKSLGTALYGKNRPTSRMPDAFTMNVHPAVWKFLHMKAQFSIINDLMGSYFCQVNMDSPEAKLSPLPTLLRQKNLTGQQLDKWKDNASKAFSHILTKYSAFECAGNGAAWKAAENEIRSLVKKDAVLIPDASRRALTVAGLTEDIQRLKGPVENLMLRAVNQIERQRDGILDEMDISPAKFYILQQEGLKKAVAAISPEMQFSYKNNTKKLALSGLAAEVYKLKTWILEREVNMSKKQLNVEFGLEYFLKSVDSMEMSQDLFTSRDINAVYCIESRGILLTGSSERALADAEKRMKDSLSQRHISIEDPKVLKMPEWKQLKNQLLDSFNCAKKTIVLMNPETDGQITVSGFLEPVNEVSNSLEDFMDKYSQVEEFVRVKSCAVAKFIKKHKSEELQRFAKTGEVQVHFDPRKPRIFISGARLYVRKAKETFRNMAGALFADDLKITKPGAKKYFQNQGQYFLPTVMTDFSCMVILQEDDMLDDEDEEEDESFGGSACCEVRTASGVLVSVTKADICKFRADAVVNAANEDLQHIGGLALALLRAAGPQLQKLSDDYISKNGRLKPGDAVVTGAGNLPCKHVVHAVGPRFTDTDQWTAVFRLKCAVRVSLEQAAMFYCKTVAIPAVSSGIFGFPLDICSDTIAQAVREYCDGSQGSLTEIHLVDNDDKRVNALAKAVQSVFSDLRPRMNQPQPRDYRGRGNRGRGQRRYGYQGPGFREQPSRGRGHWEQESRRGGGRGNRRARGSSYENREGAGHWEQRGHDRKFERGDREGVLESKHTQEGIIIVLRKGNIQEQFTDIIVNTISENADLTAGAVSNAILQAAGPQLQSAARFEAGIGKLSYGAVMITDGFNLRCQRVFHAVCPPWDNGAGQAEEALRSIVSTSLKEAEKLRLGSLSFPAIGTGNMSFPRSLVSSLMLQEVQAFSQRRTPEYLKEVAFVVHPSDTQTVDCFTREFKGQAQDNSRLGAYSSGQSRSSSQVNRYKSNSDKLQQSPAFFGLVSSPSLGVYRMQMAHLMFEVSSGDISKETSDAIVNSSNKDFNLKSGVSKAILESAGLQVELECAQIVNSPQFQPCLMITTSSGLLPCKSIIHIVGHNDPGKIKEIVYAVLKTCEELKLTSVAFPALGTGQGGASPSAVADAMIDAVVNFVRKKNGSCVRSVKILIFQPIMLTEFHKSMKRREGDEVEEKSMFTKLKDSVTNFFIGSSQENSEANFVMEKGEFDPIVFQLCAENPTAVSGAKDWIQNLILKEQAQKTINCKHISQLSQRDIEELQVLQRELSVSIRLERKGPDSILYLEGLTRDVFTADEKIRHMIQKVEETENRKQRASLLSSLVEWQYQDIKKGGMVTFDKLTNYDLEEAFQNKVTLKIKINNEDYNADVAVRKASKIRGNKVIELLRKDLKDDVSLPSHWEDMKGALMKMVALAQGSQEYNDVEQKFKKTGLIITQIERVQNESLWMSYQIRKDHLEKKNKHKNNEMQLFHGTSSTSINQINDTGFNRSYAGQHGAAYGKGSYFAVDPSYSANGYTKPDAQGHRHMYLARVLVGEYTGGHGKLIVPPAKASSKDQYDSVTDNVANPTMFVIFNDVQAYPEYLITFQ